jgi:hypothetical protein
MMRCSCRAGPRVLAAQRPGRRAGAPLRGGQEAHRGDLPRRQILTAADVVRGRRVSAYPAVGPEVRLAGAAYADIALDAAITDGNLVSAPAWPAQPEFLRQFLQLLGTTVHYLEMATAKPVFSRDVETRARKRRQVKEGVEYPAERSSTP